ncbi:protein FAR1-RELATED SEQUENCE 5-like [Panicum virgatum]|uniref:protein FAR1-RELATED SEQUENCE 5-like n=1 Tax=Panicum virgatum TaxID=38727 RepID=UPI0019D5346C|nr:protein FAR1-RELATED SEQUENCE 5-like [Panicum virgatum]
MEGVLLLHGAVDSELPPRFDGDAALPAMNEPRADHRAVLEVVSEVAAALVARLVVLPSAMEPAAAHDAMELGAASLAIDANFGVVDDHAGIAVDVGVEAHTERPSTPQYLSTTVSCTSDTCNTIPKEHLKLKIGMIFDTLKDVEEFYKSYAHEVGFLVRVGQHKEGNEEILIKTYYCSREGYRKENVTNASDESGKKRKTHNVMKTRCGCQAHIVVKLGSDKKYRIVSMVEEHSHGFMSPDKRYLLRSNRRVSERAKSTLFNCHKASIGTSQAYRLLHVSEGGFENVGCTKRDLQNYYRDLRTKIKDAGAQMFVVQLERKKEVNPAFFYEFMVDDQGQLVRVFWADAACRKNYSVFGMWFQ